MILAGRRGFIFPRRQRQIGRRRAVDARVIQMQSMSGVIKSAAVDLVVGHVEAHERQAADGFLHPDRIEFLVGHGKREPFDDMPRGADAHVRIVNVSFALEVIGRERAVGVLQLLRTLFVVRDFRFDVGPGADRLAAVL